MLFAFYSKVKLSATLCVYMVACVCACINTNGCNNVNKGEVLYNEDSKYSRRRRPIPARMRQRRLANGLRNWPD